MNIPGIIAHHRIISDHCRDRGNEEVSNDVADSVVDAVHELMEVWPKGDGSKIHILVTVETPKKGTP